MSLQYKAMGGKTYTFTTTTTITNAEIDNPTANKFGQLKCKDTDGNIFYMPITPLLKATTTTGTSSSTTPWGNSLKGSQAASPIYGMSVNMQFLTPLYDGIEVDGVKYYGFKNSSFGFTITRSNYNISPSLPAVTVCGGTVKYVKYSSVNNVIETGSYTFDDISLTSNSLSSVSSSSSVDFIQQHFCLPIPKVADDLILAISVEYDE